DERRRPSPSRRRSRDRRASASTTSSASSCAATRGASPWSSTAPAPAKRILERWPLVRFVDGWERGSHRGGVRRSGVVLDEVLHAAREVRAVELAGQPERHVDSA